MYFSCDLLTGNGEIDADELDVLFSSSLSQSDISITDKEYKQLIDSFMMEADADNDGVITFKELLSQFKKYPELLPNLPLNVPGLLQTPTRPKSSSTPALRKTLLFAPVNIFNWCIDRNNRNNLMLILVFLSINLALFVDAVFKWRAKGANWFLVVARGNGACLNLTCSLVVVLVLRKLLTHLRSTWVVKYIPIDENIDIHRYIGYAIGLQALCHTISHIGNADIAANESDGKFTMTELLFTNPHLTSLGHPWVAGTAFQTGWLLVAVLIIMIGLSMNCIRRTGYFQVFYVSHLFYAAFWILLLLHGPRFWKFFLLPGSLFLYEKVSNFIKRGGKSYIKEANLLSSRVMHFNVTHLEITKPTNFDYEPGDYVFIKIPSLAAYEWHPFTISSAPEKKDTFSLHIRCAGNWTSQLYDFIKSKICEDAENNNQPLGGERSEKERKSWKAAEKASVVSRRKKSLYAPNENSKIHKRSTIKQFESEVAKDDRLIQVLIEGPYGTPTRAIFNSEHAILIGGGIGITPFASILQSIMYRYRLSRQTCPNCDHSWMETLPTSLMTLKKVNFIWLNRDHKSFEWFIGLLAQMELEQDREDFENFLEMEMFMTNELRKSDMRGIALQMALQTMYKATQRDVLTGLKTRLQAGFPNWDKIFSDIDKNRRGCVELFFCGPPGLGVILHRFCKKYDFQYHTETF
ncbi:NADPH oxidase 5 [Holothuria leucospilota]|uniref:NADPH oxidase 5 n=1 Tax=Holothuria leucospilota TaxID=206669 RepID=A0A9Q1C0A6_HOLLE|nr:NADPH oxidase 5 [Holothuria leucospilota]